MPEQQLVVRAIAPQRHLDLVRSRPSASFLQCPSWGRVKSDWGSESVGWFDGDRLVGAGLVLYRQVPRLRRYLAYLPEGPVLDWDAAAKEGELARWLDPLVAHLRSRRAFGIRMGPPVVTRRWSASTVKAALGDPAARRLADVPADVTDGVGESVTAQLLRAGWRPPAAAAGFGAGQPRHVFQVPLAGHDEASLLASFNQLWRRNIKKADKAGVQVSLGTAADIPAFHRLYAETAARDEFTPRPLGYFRTMWDAMTAEDPDRLRLYLARHDGDLVAATTMVRVGEHAWYSYGASSTAKREVRGSNAVQWRMMRDALAAGATVYDLRGITDTLADDDPHLGLLQFKLGSGGEVVEYAGEWDLPLRRVLFRAFDLYLRRR